MTALRTLLACLRAHFSKHDHANRLEEEISAHIDALAADYEARGLFPQRRLLAARREFCGIAQMREQHRLPFADALLQDLRYAVRQMLASLASKVFTCAAIITLALGIGANTAVFEGLMYYVYRPLPVGSPMAPRAARRNSASALRSARGDSKSPASSCAKPRRYSRSGPPSASS
jgi:hypothetical protein